MVKCPEDFILLQSEYKRHRCVNMQSVFKTEATFGAIWRGTVHTRNGDDMLSHSPTTMMCFLTKKKRFSFEDYSAYRITYHCAFKMT